MTRTEPERGPRTGVGLALLLLDAFRSLTDAATAELARRGYPGHRPLHDYALRAVVSGADTASELGRRLSVSKQAAAKTIAVLEEGGYVAREPDPEDGRSIVARLTESGWKVVQAAAPGHVEAVRRLVIDPLTGPQLETLAAAAQSIVGSLEQAGSACTEHIDPCAAEDPC